LTVVIVARDQLDLFRYLTNQCDGDPHVSVVLGDTGGRLVVVEHYPPSFPEGLTSMSDSETVENRQRLEQWLEDGQFMMGRVVPLLIEERDRLRARAEAAEEDCARMRQELNELHKIITDLHSERQYVRQEHTVISDTIGTLLGQIADLQRPLHDVQRRLQSVGTHPVGETGS
jgi:FtsZ-binding cell division protein ZapB